jgi:exonuclease SbcD
MRLLHIADVHLEHSFAWLGPDRGRERRRVMRATLQRVVDLARERGVDALCIAGDLFDRENAVPSVGEFLRATFATLGDRPVLISPGNHDFFSTGGLYDQVAWTPNVHIFRTPTASAVSIGNGVVWGNAFTGPEFHTSPLESFPRPTNGTNVALFHADLIDPNAISPYGPITLGQIEAAGFCFAMLGHVHAGRTDEARRFAYPGSLEPLDVSEGGPRGALLIEASGDNLRLESIPVASKRVIGDEIDLSPFSTAADFQHFVAAKASAWDHADVRLRLVGTLHGELEDPQVVRSVLRDLDVALDLVAEPPVDIVALAAQRTILGAFVRDALARRSAATNEQHARYWSDVLRAGVAAFRGQQVTL